MNGEQLQRWIKINGEYFLLTVTINIDTGHVTTYWNGIKVSEWTPTK